MKITPPAVTIEPPILGAPRRNGRPSAMPKGPLLEALPSGCCHSSLPRLQIHRRQIAVRRPLAGNAQRRQEAVKVQAIGRAFHGGAAMGRPRRVLGCADRGW